MKEENESLSRSRPIQADQKLAAFAQVTADADKLQNLVVEEGETVVLSYSSNKFKGIYQKIKPESLEHIKELIGVPKRFQKTESSIRQMFSTCSPESSSVFKKSSLNISARMISPSVLTDENSSEEEKIEARRFAREAAKQYIYGNTDVDTHKALIEAYLTLRGVFIYVPVFNNIVVNNGATLNIAANTFLVRANNICLYGSGKIVCDGPTTFDCAIFKGNQPYMVAQQLPLKPQQLTKK